MPEPIGPDEASLFEQYGEPREFDFSIFHPLDHHWWEFRECHTWPGGTRTHLTLVWEYGQGLTKIRDWFSYWTACRWGRHTVTPYWRGLPHPSPKNARAPTGYMCTHCDASVRGPGNG